MPQSSVGKPGKAQAVTVYGRATRGRVHAIVGQIVDELEQRRERGTFDLVAKACDEIAAMPALDALAQLRDLFPVDAVPASSALGAKSLGLQGLFVSAARQLASNAGQGDGVHVGYIEAQATDITDQSDW